MAEYNTSIARDQKIGFIFAFLATLSYSTMALMAKLAVEISPSVMIFFRNFICLLIFIPGMARRKNFKVNQPGMIILRAIFVFCCLYCFYYSAKYLKLVDSVLLINTAPLFIPIIIMLWNKVKIPPNRVGAIIIGFLGILFILRPTFDFLNVAGLIGLSAGIFSAVSIVTLRKLSKTESSEIILFYLFLGTAVLSFVPMIFSWKPFEDPMTWVYLLGISILGLIFQFLTTKSYTYITPTRASVISYLSIVIGGVYEWLFYGNTPSYQAIFGVSLVIVGGMLVIYDKNPLNTIFTKKKVE